ncbi:MAG: L-aspartate oxidase [Bacteroidota bacterium]|nr:L-aspartate oxidase [Bacteroidota bacterium]
MIHQTDVLVIGSGIAGLFYALRMADERQVVLVTKKETVESNTNYAQGGIASVFDENDSFELHIEDTIRAGAGLCKREVVETVVREGPALIRELIAWGVRFTERNGKLDLGREGGHTRHRIVHAQDLTGKEIESALVRHVRNHPNVRILENHVAVELITEHNLRRGHASLHEPVHCYGAYVLDTARSIVGTFLAPVTVLSTGGCGQVYLHTTNPAIATGDGIAMAYRAGARIANLEFIQFHPTTLYRSEDHEGDRAFLISEAVRGFGALLRTSSGERFMAQYDDRLELAPRDIVARAIDAELKRRGEECVYLDLTHLDSAEVRRFFPHITETCARYGIDITRDWIPVVPAAHYVCGGVMSDLEGRSSIEGLFVCGETAMTGLHGANRLASNSLLEALVFADRAARATLTMKPERIDSAEILPWDDSDTYNVREWVLISHNRKEIQTLMWDFVGIVRSTLRLERAKRRIDFLLQEIEDFYKRTRVSAKLIELRNLALVANLIVTCALHRKESRGLHYTTDYPRPDPHLDGKDTILSIFSPPINHVAV